MMADHKPNEAELRKSRSTVTNGSTLQLFGDGRSAGARRYRDLINAFGLEAGGFLGLSATDQQVVRRLAQVSVELELLEAKRASGDAIDPVAFVTLVNVQRRLIRDLERIRASHTPTTPSLAESLANEARATADVPGEVQEAA